MIPKRASLSVVPGRLSGSKGKRKHRDPVLAALVERIVSGQVPVGGYLPIEQGLVEEFSVSRTVIREVIHELANIGLIETRPRVGARVLPYAHWDRFHAIVLRALLRHRLDAEFYEPLIEARGLIEPEVAAMAAARAKPADIQHIEACFERLVMLIDPERAATAQERVQSDIAFHHAILASCGNWVLQQFGLIFEAAIIARMSLVQQASNQDPPFALQKHRRIVDAIKTRNPSEARKAALSVLTLSKPAYADYFDHS